MQIKNSSLIAVKQNREKQADSKMPVRTMQSNLTIGFASATLSHEKKLSAFKNLKDYYLNSILTVPSKISFGSADMAAELENIKPGCNFNKDKNTLEFGLLSKNAGHIELYIYKKAYGKENDYKEVAKIQMKNLNNKWGASVKNDCLQENGIDIDKDAVYYGYRVWGKKGSNWEYDKNWLPGSDTGFKSHVDEKGNRFNPNKLLTDPEATEISHDPVTVGINEDGSKYKTGINAYKVDTAPFAPKSIFVMPKEENTLELAQRPSRPLSSDVIYETHLKGLTAGHTKETLIKLYDSFIPEYKNKPEEQQIKDMITKIQSPPEKGGWDNKYAGTYKGAGFMALYLKLLGTTEVEFLPFQEFQNSEKDNFWKNYWGYMTLSYKAPERNYAYDKTPGGPTREVKEMVNEFHKQDLKVCMDVVYNHTAESESDISRTKNSVDERQLFNLRGIDNTSYYQTTPDKKQYFDTNGCGANLNAANPIAQQLVIDSLKYWKDEIKVDSFRFDLATILGNTRADDSKGGKYGFYFDPKHKDSLLHKIETQVGVRSEENIHGVDFIAEPWGFGEQRAENKENTFQVGNFSPNYAEWNGPVRDDLRKSINKPEDISLLNLIKTFAGSSETFKYNKPRSVNFIDCHDGYTMHDLFAYNNKRTIEQCSEGGNDYNISWDQGGDVNHRKQAIRTAQVLLSISAGTPMIQGGDERYRTTLGNNNAWNLDSSLNYIDWGNPAHQADIDKLRKAGKLKYTDFLENRDEDKTYQMNEQEKQELTKFTSRLFNFRKNHPALRPAIYYTEKDLNAKNGKNINWLDGDAKEINGADTYGKEYLNNPNNAVIAYKVDSTEFKDPVTSKTDPATSIYVAYNKGFGAFNLTLPEHQLPNKQWFLVADTSSKPNKLLENENIKKEGEEVAIKGNKITCDARSALIFIEKDKVN